MAYSTINVTIAGATKPAIDVSGDGVQVILEESLDKYAKADMNLVSDSVGATFADKMAATTLSNGITADVLYADFIITTADYSTAVAAKGASFGVGSAIATLKADLDAAEVTIADHETRITTLEP